MPRHEKPKDIQAEKEFAELMLKLENVRLKKLSEVKYIIDFAVYERLSKTCIGFIEFRRRYVHSKKYKEIFCSVTKWMKLREYHQLRETAIYIQFNDRLMRLHPNWADYNIEVCGRIDRNDKNDIEPNYLLPVSDMELVHIYEEEKPIANNQTNFDPSDDWRKQLELK